MSRVRLAALGSSHETNTFARLPATYARFQEDGILRGDEILREFAESHATLAGYLAAGRQPDIVVPLLFTQTNRIGTITADAFERIVCEMLDRLRPPEHPATTLPLPLRLPWTLNSRSACLAPIDPRMKEKRWIREAASYCWRHC